MYRNREVIIRNSNGRIIEINRYDVRGNMVYFEDSVKKVSYTHEYNDDNLLIKSTLSNGSVHTYKYRDNSTFISQRVIYNPTRCPQHNITDYVREGDVVLQYLDDDLKFRREYSYSDTRTIMHLYDSHGKLCKIKHKDTATDNLIYLEDIERDIVEVYEYENGKLIEVIKNYGKERLVYTYNGDDTIDTIFEYKYTESGKFLKRNVHKYNYSDMMITSITINNRIYRQYEYNQL